MSSTIWPAQRQCSRLRVDEATVPLPHTNVDAICRALVSHGVCIVEGAYPTRQIEQLKVRAARLCARALKLARTLPWRWREYITAFSETMRHRKRCVDLPDGTQLIELAPGRYDISYKMTTPPFLDVLYADNGILREVARRMLVEDYKAYVGALPSGGHASAGHWPRYIPPVRKRSYRHPPAAVLLHGHRSPSRGSVRRMARPNFTSVLTGRHTACCTRLIRP